MTALAGTDVLIYSVAENGDLSPGWVRVRGAMMPAMVAQVIGRGLEALNQVGKHTARAAEIRKWVHALNERGYLEPGEYRLAGEGRIVVEAATKDNMLAAHQRSALIQATSRPAPTRQTGTSTKSPASHAVAKARAAAAIAKARIALTQ